MGAGMIYAKTAGAIAGQIVLKESLQPAWQASGIAGCIWAAELGSLDSVASIPLGGCAEDISISGRFRDVRQMQATRSGFSYCERHIANPEGDECYPLATVRHGDPAQLEANAALIAAAPDMLEALEDFVASFGICGVTEAARAAIAKATGDAK